MEINFEQKNLMVVPISTVHLNEYNPKDKDTEQYKKVVESIRINGLKLPIVVRQVGGIDGYVIIDGEQRFTACSELGYEKVIIYNEGEITEQRAKELTLWYQVQVEVNEAKLAQLVTTMIDLPDLHIPYSDEEIQNFKKLVNFNWDDYKQVDMPHDVRMETIRVTEEQLKIIEQAVDLIKQEHGSDISIGRGLELICADYIGSVQPKE